ncbi:MAG: hypothetical protein KKA79_05890 [Nanoarchaeota archaeon]|nr:hypothetical protein [Nanoarchaeota archaeon]
MKKIGDKITDNNLYVIIDVPNLEGCFDYSNTSFLDFLNIGHIWYFNSITLERLLNQANLSIDFLVNRGAAFTVVCSKVNKNISNKNNAYWNTVSSINYANYKNDPKNIGIIANKVYKSIHPQ